MQFEKLLFIAGGLHDGKPVGGKFPVVQSAQVEEELQVHVHEPRYIFGAFNVTRHPVKRVCDAGKHLRLMIDD